MKEIYIYIYIFIMEFKYRWSSTYDNPTLKFSTLGQCESKVHSVETVL